MYQEVKLSAALEVNQGVGAMMTGLVEGIQNKTNRFKIWGWWNVAQRDIKIFLGSQWTTRISGSKHGKCSKRISGSRWFSFKRTSNRWARFDVMMKNSSWSNWTFVFEGEDEPLCVNNNVSSQSRQPSQVKIWIEKISCHDIIIDYKCTYFVQNLRKTKQFSKKFHICYC